MVLKWGGTRERGGNKSENQFKSLNEVRKVNNAGEGHGKERKRKQAMNLGSPKIGFGLSTA